MNDSTQPDIPQDLLETYLTCEGRAKEGVWYESTIRELIERIARDEAPVRDEEWAHKYDTYLMNRKEVDALISNRGK